MDIFSTLNNVRNNRKIEIEKYLKEQKGLDFDVARRIAKEIVFSDIIKALDSPIELLIKEIDLKK